MRICSACILSTASFSRSLGPLNASPLSAPPAAAAAAAVAPAAALLLLDATKALYVAMRSTSCGWPVPPPPCASAESAILPSVTSQSTSSVGTSSSMTPARRALCLLTRSRVLPYSVLYERSGSSSPSERTITSRRSDRSINMMPSESGCESVIKSCVMTCAALTVSACFSCCLTSGTLLGRLVWWAAVAAAGADAGAAAAGAAASLSDAAGRFPPSAADCSCRAGSGGGARFWPVMSNFDISASRGSSGFMLRFYALLCLNPRSLPRQLSLRGGLLPMPALRIGPHSKDFFQSGTSDNCADRRVKLEVSWPRSCSFIEAPRPMPPRASDAGRPAMS